MPVVLLPVFISVCNANQEWAESFIGCFLHLDSWRCHGNSDCEVLQTFCCSLNSVSGSRSSKYQVHALGQARLSGQMVSVWFLSLQLLLLLRCVVWWGRVDAVFCPFLSGSGFYGSGCDAYGEDGMILGLLVVPHAITLYLGMDFLKLILDFFCHCAFPEFLWRAAWNSGLPQCLP